MAKQGIDGLTDKQRVFRDAVTEGLDLSAAYCRAFDTSGMNERTIRKRAGDLAKLPKIAAYITAQQGEATRLAAEKLSYTLIDAIQEADRLIGVAEAEGQSGAAVSAATLKAKLAGHLVERKEVRSGPLDDADLSELNRLRQQLAESEKREALALELAGGQPLPGAWAREDNRPQARARW